MLLNWQKKKFKIFQFIDNWYDIENRLNKTNGFNQYPDHLLLPDEYLKKITNKFYDNHGKIEVVGHPAFENVNFKYRKKCDKILIIDQPLSENNLTLGYTEFDFYETMIKFLKLNSIDLKM